MSSPRGKKHMSPSMGSPSKGLNMSWVPEGMDSSSACRLYVRIPNYAEVADDGSTTVHPVNYLNFVVDRDRTNVEDITAEIAAGMKLGTNQGMSISFWNKRMSKFCSLSSDALLMEAMDLYWDMRRVPLYVDVHDTVAMEYSQSVSMEHCVSQGNDSALVLQTAARGRWKAKVLNQHVDSAKRRRRPKKPRKPRSNC